MKLIDYIKKYYPGKGCRTRFALSQGISTAQLNQWLVNEYQVIDHVLVSTRRKLLTHDIKH